MGLLSKALEQQFEAFVRKAFQHRFGSTFADDRGEVDFISESTSGQKALVEVKVYRADFAVRSIAFIAAQHLANARVTRPDHVAVLVLNTGQDQGLAEELRSTFGVHLYDIDLVGTLVRDEPALLAELNQIRQRFAYLSPPRPIDLSREIPALAPLSGVDDSAPAFRGLELLNAVLAVPAGERPADFEIACGNAVKFLFDGMLTEWRPQHNSESKLHRYDLIAKNVTSTEDLWRCLREDFRGRYVIFEFKNYKSPISQKEIYSTEKYLFPHALRSIAIVIARHGADDNAMEVTRGSLREGGKVILVCSLDQLAKMLELKDRGEDPSVILLETFDQMLMSVER